MGYEKFGHLSFKECCECICEHLLPVRKASEINRKLTDILKTDERKEKNMVSARLKIKLKFKSILFTESLKRADS